MWFGTLVISRSDWLWPAGLLFILAAAGMAWGFRGNPATGATRIACAVLKVIALLALGACLIEPTWIGQRAKPGANLLALVADNSQSLGIKDRGETESRGQRLRALLTARDSPWQSALEETFQLRRYGFDARLQGLRDFSELTFEGRATAIGAALRAVTDRFQGQSLAGILLFTDGNATDLTEGSLPLAGVPPVYPVMIGRDEAFRDVALRSVGVSRTAFEDTPVTVQAEVSASGYAGRELTARLMDVDGKTVEEQRTRAPRDGGTATVRFQLQPHKPGLAFYRLLVSAADEQDQFTRPNLVQEATLANNLRVVVVDRGGGPYRILYVGGRPNWEFKFLNRALADDEQLQLVGLIRVARREPKFQFRGRTGEASNPLFRGFDRKTEETERYDQPVLVRLNTKDGAELASGFPKTAEDLFAYHAVILDDVESDFFTHDQMALLQRFVSERGGGFLMLGGADSFQSGRYEHTPVGEMLPVYLDRAPGPPPAGELRLALTREGWLQPWARLRSHENEETGRLGSLAPFQVLNPLHEVKPGASIIATVTDTRQQSFPALVTQRFGRGRAGALLLGDFWHSGLSQEDRQQDLQKAWRQMTRWLVADVPDRIEAAVAAVPGDANQAVRLRVEARDRKFLPLDNATVVWSIRQVISTEPGRSLTPAAGLTPNTNTVRLSAEPSATEAGAYEATFVPRASGAYQAEAVVTDAQGAESGRAQVGWTTDPAGEEFGSLRPNRPVLEAIARQTGGQVVSERELSDLATRLPRRAAPVSESWAMPLWHRSTVFLLALVCLAAEWGLRRRRGLA
jgi:hypothetical protein